MDRRVRPVNSGDTITWMALRRAIIDPLIRTPEGSAVNLANSISVFRLALIPVVLGLIMAYEPGNEWVRYLAFTVFATAAISDFVDGYVARNFDQRTKLGAVLDPLADKLLINLTLVFLAVTPRFDTQVPQWLPVVILGRDITIAVGSYLLNRYMGPLRVRPRILGKVATFGHGAGIGWVLLNWPYGYQVLMIMVTISVASLVDYLFHGYERTVAGEKEGAGELES